MEIPVLIEPVPPHGFRARSGEPLALSAEGATREEALEKLRELVKESAAAGRLLVPLQVAAGDNPWPRMAGIFRDDPLFDEWQAAIAEYRRQVEEDPEAL